MSQRKQMRGAKRSGFTLTELVVSATLLVTIMGIVAPLTVRSGRLWQDSRHRQLAMDELTNQLERLTALPPQQRQRAIADLVPPPHLRAAMPSAVITAETIRDEEGTRLVLRLIRDGDGPKLRSPSPITLVGWLDPLPGDIASEEALP